MFLLSLMDEESAFWTLCFVVTQILPKDFFAQNDNPLGLQQEKFILNNLIKTKLELNQGLLEKITNILDVSASVLLSSLLVNFTNFEVSFETWNMMVLNKSVIYYLLFYVLI